MLSSQEPNLPKTSSSHRLPANAPAEQENTAQEGQPPEGAPRMRVREEDLMQVDGVEDDMPASFAAVAQSRKRKAEDGPAASGPIKLRRVEPQEGALKKRLEARRAITSAIVTGNIDELKKLVGPNSEMLEMKHPSSEATPLLEAVWGKQFECVKLLLECGANANCTGAKYEFDSNGDDPGYYAQLDTQLVKPRDDSIYVVVNQTPLINAIEQLDLDLIELFLRHGAKFDKQSCVFSEDIQYAIGCDEKTY